MLNFLAYPQYQLKSPYLMNPALVIGYVDSCARFWSRTYDSINGGCYTNIDKFGNLIPSTTNQKNMQTQSRNAYGFVRAFMLTGNELYLQRARHTLNFMYQHAWDITNGGWFWELDKFGNPTLNNTNKDAFHQHYALLGPMAYFEATGDTLDYFWLMKGFDNNENKMWDNRSSYFGYYDYCSSNWVSKNGKSFNSTVDALTTHLIYLYLVTKNQNYLNKSLQIVDNIRNRFVASIDAQQIGFAEKFDNDWNIKTNETMTLMGHVLKTAWCLGRIYQFYHDTSFIAAAKKLILNVYNKGGYDKQLGGPYKDFNRVTGQMLMWGNPDTAKAWWQMEQAVTAGLIIYHITNEPLYLKIADETLDFFMKYFVDHIYGDVFENRTRYGAQTWGENKGNPNKAGYHSIELGYYAYLYGKFFVKKEPISLFYYFYPFSFSRSINLNPIELPFDKYRITEVLLNNQAYSDFDPIAHTINIPVGISGKFKVTYELTNPNSVFANDDYDEKNFQLYQNYPNPFNPGTTIKYRISTANHVTLKIFDVLGNEIAILVDKLQQPGSYEESFYPSASLLKDKSELSSGVYFYQLKIGQFTATKKMLYLK
jgi:mannose/cellobiose epimerase-like protein (N-acyl-D-glucosamine 2-epimerase family)